MPWLYDAHIHLSDSVYAPGMESVLLAMGRMRIKACCVSTDHDTSLRALDLAGRSRLILPFLGVHPEEAQEDTGAVERLIEENSSAVAGVGEIGLDRTLASGERFGRQRTVFERMLGLAERLGKPVSVHSRKTLDEVCDILPSFNTGGVLLHWFDGGKRQLARAMDLGFYVSYGPVMVYANDKRVLLSKTDRDRILVETDGPVRFSRCFGHRPAGPGFIPSVVFCASQVLRLPYPETCSMLERNSERFLGV